jgi:hypothetical protein
MLTLDNFILEMETLLEKYKSLDYYEIEKLEKIIRQLKTKYNFTFKWENHCC